MRQVMGFGLEVWLPETQENNQLIGRVVAIVTTAPRRLRNGAPMRWPGSTGT